MVHSRHHELDSGDRFQPTLYRMEILRSLTETQGYFLRREALELGFTDRVLAAGIRHRTWLRIRQGAYC
ncbi:MAG: hypothetical protein JWO11_333, partial [Nocardioides sp.]|nr:hypothetical protein [Nocardioides sp.]